MAVAIGACATHSERVGPACTRCGTFACDACSRLGLCPACQALQAVTPAQVVGFAPRAVARSVDVMLFIVIAGIAASLYRRACLLVGRTPGPDDSFADTVCFFVLFTFFTLATDNLARLVGGASVGDLFLRLRVVRVDGWPLTAAALFARVRLGFAESLPTILDSFRHQPLKQRPCE